jgi:predicted ArsR family transcriptional regulator
MTDFPAQVAGVAALGEPVRRDLYLYVVGAGEPVSREQAAQALGLAPHTAKFHLDRLADEGLLATEYRRLGGRRGPGAGRPTKLYRRSAREVSVSLPPRHYDLAGRLMARAIDRCTRDGEPVLDALHREAADLGRGIGELAGARDGPDGPDNPDGPVDVATLLKVLGEHGFEPREEPPGVTMANCPFATLAREHPELVCGMNLTLVTAIDAGLGGTAIGTARLRARLDPGPGRCCVVLTAEPPEHENPPPGGPPDEPTDAPPAAATDASTT